MAHPEPAKRPAPAHGLSCRIEATFSGEQEKIPGMCKFKQMLPQALQIGDPVAAARPAAFQTPAQALTEICRTRPGARRAFTKAEDKSQTRSPWLSCLTLTVYFCVNRSPQVDSTGSGFAIIVCFCVNAS